jgi:DNA-binding Xre family transcriptional regulator
MILSNLSTILGKKKLKISDLVKSTSVTRPTLTALYYNAGKGINFDTLEVLCRYLQTTPGELLSFYDIDVESINLEYTSYSNDNFIVDSEQIKSINTTYIGDANFNGFIKFKQQNLSVLKFNGWLSAIKNNGKYSCVLNLHCDKSTYPEDVLNHIANTVLASKLISKFPSKEILTIFPIMIDYNNETIKNFK